MVRSSCILNLPLASEKSNWSLLHYFGMFAQTRNNFPKDYWNEIIFHLIGKGYTGFCPVLKSNVMGGGERKWWWEWFLDCFLLQFAEMEQINPVLLIYKTLTPMGRGELMRPGTRNVEIFISKLLAHRHSLVSCAFQGHWRNEFSASYNFWWRTLICT